MRDVIKRQLLARPWGREILERWRAFGRNPMRVGQLPRRRQMLHPTAPVRLWVALAEENRALEDAYRSLSSQIEIGPGPASSEPGPHDYLYRPASLAGALSANQLANALLALGHRPFDFLLVSNRLDEPPGVGALDPRDALIIAAQADRARSADGALPRGARGRILRVLPGTLEGDGRSGEGGSGDGRLLSIDELGLGTLHADGADLWCPHSGGGVPALPDARRPAAHLGTEPDSRPLVYVISIFMAVGGAERNLIEIMRSLRDRYRFVVLCTERVAAERGSLNHQCLREAEALFELGEIGTQEELLDLVEALARDHPPDLVFITNGSPWLLRHARVLRQLFAGIPIVDQQVYDTREGWIQHFADAGIQEFDRFIAINRGIRDVFLDQYCMDPGRVDLIYHAIDATRFHPTVAAETADRCDERVQRLRNEALALGGHVFVWVGRLTDQKNPQALIEFARRSQRANSGDRFVMVGAGPLASECDELIESNGCGDVILRIAYCDDMTTILPFASGLVVTSRYEGLPVVVLEALASGVPVASTNVGEVGALLEETGSGRMLGAGDAQGITEVVALWTHFQKFREDLPRLREVASRSAASIAERFSAESVADQYDRSWKRAGSEMTSRSKPRQASSAAWPRGGAAPDLGVSDEADRAGMDAEHALPAISIVIPTFDRCDLLAPMLESCVQNAGGIDLEFVVIDDGSTDDTAIALEKLASEIPNLVWESVPKGGPGRARNRGAMLASNEILLFMGDDIRPRNENFFRAHAELHAAHADRGLAVVGKVVWPSDRAEEVNFVMAHVQGRQGEQFGYADLRPFSFLDWRFFYTANVSVKRSLVSDWNTEGFDPAFTLAAYEDAEFAYRMMVKREPGMRLLYTSASVGTHHHPFSVDRFMQRQIAAGMMGRVFTQLHPGLDVRDLIGFGGVHHALNSPADADDDASLADYLSLLEGIKSWARLLEARMNLGAEHWHSDFLHAVFAACYLQGYVQQGSGVGANQAAAYRMILQEFARRVDHAVHTELGGLAVLRIGETRTDTPMSDHWLKQTRIWQWARRRPMLHRAYMSIKRRVASKGTGYRA